MTRHFFVLFFKVARASVAGRRADRRDIATSAETAKPSPHTTITHTRKKIAYEYLAWPITAVDVDRRVSRYATLGKEGESFLFSVCIERVRPGWVPVDRG